MSKPKMERFKTKTNMISHDPSTGEMSWLYDAPPAEILKEVEAARAQTVKRLAKIDSFLKDFFVRFPVAE